jgi:hypothetical protein
MTAARLQLAFKSGLKVEQLNDYEDLADAIAQHSLQPIEALALAKTYNMQYPEKMASYAAFYRELQLLQWLYERRCAWSEHIVWAARGGSVDVLIWLRSVTAPWSDEQKAHMLLCATQFDELDAVNWLRETAGAPWPRELHAANLHRSSVLGYNS